MNKDKIKEDILHIWDNAGLDAEVEARVLAKKLKEDPDLTRAGTTNGRQLHHPQVGSAFGRDGVLGAISKNVDGISLKDLASNNNIATKKISAGLITKIVFSLIGDKSSKALYFPVMWKPIVNYFLGKMFGDSKITKEEYNKGIKQITINEGTIVTYNIKDYLIQEGVVDHLRNNWGKYALGGAGLAAANVAAGQYMGASADADYNANAITDFNKVADQQQNNISDVAIAANPSQEGSFFRMPQGVINNTNSSLQDSSDHIEAVRQRFIDTHPTTTSGVLYNKYIKG